MSSFGAHPVGLFYQHELPFSLSCDNILLSGNDILRPTPSNELLHLAREVMTAKKDKMENKIVLKVYIWALLCVFLRNLKINLFIWILLKIWFIFIESNNRIKRDGKLYGLVCDQESVPRLIQMLLLMLLSGLTRKSMPFSRNTELYFLNRRVWSKMCHPMPSYICLVLLYFQLILILPLLC